ncbi:MAG: GntR family transcriptional regulator [Candidatus Dormibacteria bacterium]
MTGPPSEEALVPGKEQLSALPVASVTDVVYTHLRQLILRQLAPGSPLRLNDLASELGVSTTPVRVAVERLRAEGLVVHQRGKGSSVAPLSVKDLLDIYAVRVGLESVAASRGAPELDDAEIQRMREDVQRLGALNHDDLRDLPTYLEAEWAMHEVCYEAAGHRRLLQEIRSYRRQAERYFRLALAQGMNARDDFHHQQAFFEACAARDGAAAERLARSLLEWTVERVAPMLRMSDATDPAEHPDHTATAG